MTTHTTVREVCWRCDGAGDVPREDGGTRVCPTCMGQQFKDVTPDAPACDLETHRVVPQADGVP